MEYPVTGLSFPSELLIGQTLFLGSTGFNATSKVNLKNADGNRTALEVLGYNDGLSCKVSATWYTPGEDTPETIELSYELDADGYVMKVSYKMPWDENPTEITFGYEQF